MHHYTCYLYSQSLSTYFLLPFLCVLPFLIYLPCLLLLLSLHLYSLFSCISSFLSASFLLFIHSNSHTTSSLHLLTLSLLFLFFIFFSLLLFSSPFYIALIFPLFLPLRSLSVPYYYKYSHI